MPMNGMVPPVDPQDPQMLSKAVMANADRRTARPEGDMAMQAISQVRQMAEEDPSFRQALMSMVEQMKGGYSERMPRRGYNAP